MSRKGKCFICSTEFDIDDDMCPCCDWFYLGYEDKMPEEEYNSENGTSIGQAKANFAKGLNIWGEPIKK